MALTLRSEIKDKDKDLWSEIKDKDKDLRSCELVLEDSRGQGLSTNTTALEFPPRPPLDNFFAGYKLSQSYLESLSLVSLE